MKLVACAAFMALIPMAALSAAVLPASSAFAAAPAVGPSNALLGTWVNTNSSTDSVVNIVASDVNGQLEIDAYGACSPTPCQWGNVPATAYGTNAGSTKGASFQAEWTWDSGYARNILLGHVTYPDGVATLVVQEPTIFISPDPRSNFTDTETFVRASSPITPTSTGTAASDDPVGNSVTPVSALLGTWVNTNSHTEDITEIIVAENSSGGLTVNAFGACEPTDCNWGTVDAVTFDNMISPYNGSAFLAPYAFGFANALLSGSLNGAGTRLTVRNFTAYTSGGEALATLDTFKKAS
jgi:hypothetical protein